MEKNLHNAIEAILFTSGDGLSTDFLAENLGVSEDKIIAAIEKLQKHYSGDNGIHLIKYRKSYQFSSNPKYSETISSILNPIKERSLTKAALETMAIVAYKQPITRLEIEDIRGVDSTYAVSALQANKLIEVVGRKDSIGKPFLYGTTDAFLKRFELTDIDALPSYEELIEKIKVIHIKEQDKKPTDIYEREVVVDGVPEFLQGEDVELVE